MSADIIDRIDELVDESLAGGEPHNGFDFGDPEYPRCPHCDRHWHGLPVTERIAGMYSVAQYDEDYRVDTDDSPVLCPGSDFIGPARAATGFVQSYGGGGSWGRRDIAMSIVVEWDMSAWHRAIESVTRSFERMRTSFEGSRSWTIAWPSYGSPRRGFGTRADAPWIIFDEAWNAPGPSIECTSPLPELDIKFGPENWHLDFQYIPSNRQFPSLWRRADPLSQTVGAQWRQFTAPDFPIPDSPGYDFSSYNDGDPAHTKFTDQTKRGRRD